MSYVIRNCPAYLIEEDYCTCYLEVCSDCTGCVIKRVIEKCKEHPFKDCACGDDILQLFDIEEVNK